MRYPAVLGERETLQLVLTGRMKGFARFGDGDLGVMRGQRDVYQDADPTLAAALAECMADPAEGCLNCLPRPVRESDTLFFHRWKAFSEANAGLIPLFTGSPFGSSYISRMDSVPELHTTAYWCEVARLWVGKDVTLVRGSDRSLTADKLMASPSPPASVTEVLTPFRNSWKVFHETYEKVHAIRNRTVLLCTGLMARPLAHELVRHGHNAFDLGHLGLYFDSGRPRILSECR